MSQPDGDVPSFMPHCLMSDFVAAAKGMTCMLCFKQARLQNNVMHPPCDHGIRLSFYAQYSLPDIELSPSGMAGLHTNT